jgi:hypothetical protein
LVELAVGDVEIDADLIGRVAVAVGRMPDDGAFQNRAFAGIEWLRRGAATNALAL